MKRKRNAFRIMLRENPLGREREFKDAEKAIRQDNTASAEYTGFKTRYSEEHFLR